MLRPHGLGAALLGGEEGAGEEEQEGLHLIPRQAEVEEGRAAGEAGGG